MGWFWLNIPLALLFVCFRSAYTRPAARPMPEWQARRAADSLSGYASPLSQAASRYHQQRHEPATDLASTAEHRPASRKPAPPERKRTCHEPP
jgi:hypothetical protein